MKLHMCLKDTPSEKNGLANRFSPQGLKLKPFRLNSRPSPFNAKTMAFKFVGCIIGIKSVNELLNIPYLLSDRTQEVFKF